MNKLERLNKKFDELQNVYGCKELHSVYGYGCKESPKLALVFINPTGKNISTLKDWQGIRAPWLGMKPIWSFLSECELFDSNLNEEIKNKKANEWTLQFCQRVYNEVEKRQIWITNLAKCSQIDARPLEDEIFLKYKELLKEEIRSINPRKIIFFGNQVSSIMLEENICVSLVRKKKFFLKIANKEYESYAIYYPVGNGRFNKPKAIEDLKEIVNA